MSVIDTEAKAAPCQYIRQTTRLLCGGFWAFRRGGTGGRSVRDLHNEERSYLVSTGVVRNGVKRIVYVPGGDRS